MNGRDGAAETAAVRGVVFDRNVFLQAMLSARGPAGACWERVRYGGLRLFVSSFVLAEIRALPAHPKLQKFRQLTAERVERFVEAVIDAAEVVPDPPAIFVYARDPDHAPYVDLAVASGAMLIVSNDKDLLDLMDDRNTEGAALRARHPEFVVLTPPQLLQRLPPPGLPGA